MRGLEQILTYGGVFLNRRGSVPVGWHKRKDFASTFPPANMPSTNPICENVSPSFFLKQDSYLQQQMMKRVSGKRSVSCRSFEDEAEANSVWMRGYFNGYVGDLEWAQEVRENAARIVTDADSVDAFPPFTESAPVAEPIPAKVAEENLGSEPEPLLFSEETLTSEGLKQVPATVEEIEAELLKTLFPDEWELHTESSIENVVREQFSPQRFNAAVQTLSQYGPQEGLRRLKVSDPEIAIYVERLIQRNKETGK